MKSMRRGFQLLEAPRSQGLAVGTIAIRSGDGGLIERERIIGVKVKCIGRIMAQGPGGRTAEIATVETVLAMP
jgi:hypothetical protein